jgi:hypothetical protein
LAPCEGNGRVNGSTGENGRGDGGELHGERWGIGIICLRAVWIGAKEIKAQEEEFENLCSKSDGNFVGFIDFWESTTPFLLLLGI